MFQKSDDRNKNTNESLIHEAPHKTDCQSPPEPQPLCGSWFDCWLLQFAYHSIFLRDTGGPEVALLCSSGCEGVGVRMNR